MKTSNVIFLLAALGLGANAAAQSPFPNGPIRMIVPFAAGGGVDNAARLLARQMQADMNVSVVVENRGGANGTIGGQAVQTATPDGQTLLFSASTHVLAKQVVKAPPYDPVTDFEPVARVAEAPLLLVIAPELAPRTVTEVMEAVKREPNKWTAGIPALGAASHLATLLLAKEGNMPLMTAAYKGTAPALADVAGSHIQMLMDSIISLQAMAKAGKVRPIAVTSAKRSSIMPDVPSVAESGHPNLVTESWYGVWAPKGTPADRVQHLNASVNRAMKALADSGALEQLGVQPVIESIDAFKAYTDRYVKQSAELLAGAGFKAE